MNFGRLVFVTPSVAFLSLGCVANTPPPVEPKPPPPATSAEPAATAPQAFAASAPDYSFADPDRRKKLAAAFPAIHALAREAGHAQGIPALQIGIVIDGKLVDTGGFTSGNYDPKISLDKAVFRIGSLTKSFTALAILALRDDGKLSLDDPLTRFIPEASGLVYPTRDSRPITIRQLLNHVSGLPRLGSFDYTRSDREPSERDVTDSLKGFALANAPGTTFEYSNLGFALLGIVVAHASGKPYRAFMAERIFKPLGMTASGLDPSEIAKDKLLTGFKRGAGGGREPASPWMLGASEGAGGIYSTIGDLARYVAFELDAYPARSGADDGPVRRATLREAHFSTISSGLVVRNRAAAKGEPTVDVTSTQIGLGWVRTTSCDYVRIWHNGAVDGFASAAHFLPDRGVGIVVLANFVEADLDSIAEGALHELAKTGALVPRETVVAPDASFDAAMKRFVAVYNDWDEPAYAAMLTRSRPPIAPKAEQDELGGYKAIHGKCRGYKPIHLESPVRGKVLMECEKGTLEMSIALDPNDKLIAGFDGHSKGMPVPPKLRPAANAVAALVTKWDDRLFKKHLQPRSSRPKESVASFYEIVRADHGACKPASAERDGDGSTTIVLACDRGGDLNLALKVDEKAPDVIESYSITPASRPGTCPVR